ncbi:DUF6979 family protein [Anaeromyxobacter dehalogenans]
MGKYGNAALRATELVSNRTCRAPSDAWSIAIKELFPSSPSSQKKACPKGAYLGLCEEGLILGVPRGSYTRSDDNKRYAVDAVQLLRREPDLADASARDSGATNLWLLVMRGKRKTPNHQMDVVLSLWNHGLIAGSRTPR